jgi:uncharacterized protein YndB with AHSA1/START domain
MAALLGLILVLHGLATSVLPLRGVDAAGPGSFIPLIALLYALAIVGFTAAGLGVLGVRPLDRVVIPTVWIAALCAPAAQLRAPSSDLWVGIALNTALPILTTLFVLRARHERPPLRLWSRVASTVALLFLAWIAVGAAAWPWTRGWGTTAAEWQMALPGDRTPRTPQLEIMHAVTIAAPPEAVWPWLAQLGQDRAGFYSYDWLERAFGANVHNVSEIRPEWQTRAVGEHVYATEPGYLGGIFGERPGWRIEMFEPNRVLVLQNWGAFVLVPQPDGGTRFLIRSTISHERIPAWAAALNFSLFELPHFIMQRRMLLGIKQLAEQTTT